MKSSDCRKSESSEPSKGSEIKVAFLCDTLCPLWCSLLLRIENCFYA
jgi:hypothetical protein